MNYPCRCGSETTPFTPCPVCEQPKEEQTTMPENPNIQEGQTPVNLDEIEPESAGAPENGSHEPPECEDSPTGQHEFDTSDDDEDIEVCVYCGHEKGQE